MIGSQTSQVVRRRIGRITTLVTMLGLLMLPTTALAATPAQDDDAPQLILGQFAHVDAAEGDELVYSLPIEGGGTYVITSGDSEQAAKFDFSLQDEQGNEVAGGQFEDTQVELEPSAYTLSFTAKEAGELSVVVVGYYGELSDDESNPGTVFNGSVVEAEKLEGPLYAKMSLYPSDFYQMALVVVQGGEGDEYDISVSGDDVYASAISSDDAPLSFWSKGGEFDLIVTPLSGGEKLQVIIFQSGQAPLLSAGEAKEGELADENAKKYYSFEVSEAGALVHIGLASEDEDSDLTISASINPENAQWVSYESGSNDHLSFVAPHAGQYFVEVKGNYGGGKYEVSIEEGDLAEELPANSRLWGAVGAGENALYRMVIDEPGSLLTVVMVGGGHTDLDLQVALYDELGAIVHYETPFHSGSAEIVAITDAQPGVYEVSIRNAYSDEENAFSLVSRVEHPLDFTGQWATGATASSEYQEENNSAAQATGAPDTFDPGDFPTAWAASESDGGEETLELTFDVAVIPSAVNIYETFNPGAVTMIEAYNEADDEWVVLWEGDAEAPDEVWQIFSPELEAVDFATNQIRLTIDEPAIAGWNEIDAVELQGTP